MSDSAYFTPTTRQSSVATWLDNVSAALAFARFATVVHYTGGPQTLAASADVITCDLTGGAFTVNLPADPSPGDRYAFAKVDASGNALTIGRNGNTINGAASDGSTSTQWAVVQYVWCEDANTWLTF